jgi:Lrp/AsnC family leucine-responsive transcriptional regulator
MRTSAPLPFNSDLQFIDGPSKYCARCVENPAPDCNKSPFFRTLSEYYAEIQVTTFNATDGAIMRALQQDGRLSNVELARRVNLSPSACLRRVQILEERGAIAKYVALLDPQALDLTGLAFVFVTLERMSRKDMETFERAVMKPAEIQECFLIAGSNDYLVRVTYRDSTDLERIHTDILMKLPGVIRTQSTLVLRMVKKTTALKV